MKTSNLHINDALQGATPGTLVASKETKTLHGPLAELLGDGAASQVLTHAGRAGVGHMNADELVATTGIEPHQARRLVTARRLFDVCHHDSRAQLCDASDVLEALPVELRSLEVEVLLAVALDARMRSVGTILLAQGSPAGTAILPRYVFTPLVRLNARAFVLCHNHPSGAAAPSRDDVTFTNAVAKLGYALDLLLVDHVIVGGNEVCSFADLGLLPSREQLARLEVSCGDA